MASPSLPFTSMLPADYGRFPGVDAEWQDKERKNYALKATKSGKLSGSADKAKENELSQPDSEAGVVDLRNGAASNQRAFDNAADKSSEENDLSQGSEENEPSKPKLGLRASRSNNSPQILDPNVERRLKRKQREQKIQENPPDENSLLSNVRERWQSPREHVDIILKGVFGIGPRTEDSPASKLIYPLSPFAMAWMGLTCCFLAYTAIVTPAVISFHWLDSACQSVPTLYFDCVLDTFFLFDIIFSFNLGVIYQGQYYDDKKWVAWHYVKGAFAFDVFTSIPVSFVELSVKMACDRAAAAGETASSTIDASQLRFIRAMKPLRWFKLARIIKLNNAGNVISFACDWIGLEPRHQRLAHLAGRIIGLIHLGACFVWLVKVTTTSPSDIEEFLDAGNWGEDVSADITSTRGKLKAYSICTYFVTTVFSTVGFGDMSATNATERLLYSILMLYGILVFGNLLSELAELNHASRAEEIEKMESVQAAVDFMGGHDVPRSLNNEVLRWTRFHYAHSKSNAKKKDFLDNLPSNLQAELVTIVFGEVLSKVPIFELLRAEDENFLMEVWTFMKYETYTPDSPIVELGHPADRLIVVISGEMTVFVENEDKDQSDTCSFKSGDFLGDFALLGDPDWGSSTLVNVPNVNVEAYTIPEHFAVCLVVEAVSFRAIIDQHNFEMHQAIDRFKQLRLQSRLDGAEGGQKAVSAEEEARRFTHSNKMLIKWTRVAKACLKMNNISTAEHSFFTKLNRSVMNHEGNTDRRVAHPMRLFNSSSHDRIKSFKYSALPANSEGRDGEHDEDHDIDMEQEQIDDVTMHEGDEVEVAHVHWAEDDGSSLGRVEHMFSALLARLDAQDAKIDALSSAVQGLG